MKLILLDFLRRWWWLLAILCLLTAATLWMGHPMNFAPIFVSCLMIDAQRGMIQAVRPLPVSRRRQALAWWSTAVLMPLAVLPFAAAGILAGRWVPGLQEGLARISPWTCTAYMAWTGLGLSALVFMLFSASPARRLPVQWRPAGVALLRGICIPVGTVMLMMLPSQLSRAHPWHWVVVSLVPVALLLSWRGALSHSRDCRDVVPPEATSAEPAGGSTGMRLLVAVLHGRALLMGLLMVAMITCLTLIRAYYRDEDHTLTDSNRMEFVPYAMMSFIMILPLSVAETFSLRVLRVMPLSTSALVRLLLSLPVLLGLQAATFTALWARWGDAGQPLVVNFLAQAAGLAGLAALVMYVMLRITSAWRGLIYVPVPMFCFYLGTLRHTQLNAYFFAGGLALLVLAGALLHHSLRHSTAIYRPRRRPDSIGRAFDPA